VVLVLAQNCSYAQLSFNSLRASLSRGKKMKAFQRRRIIDDRFALTTLQNPSLEIRSKIEMVEDAAREFDARAAAALPPEPSNSAPPAPPSLTPEEIQADLDLASTLPLLKKLAERESLIATMDPEPYQRSTAEQEIAPEPEKKVESSAQEKSAKTTVKVRRTFKKKRVPRRPSPLARQKQSASTAARSLAPRRPRREPTDLERHARKCLICKHPDREDIDQEFLSWHHPDDIADDFDLPETRYLYRHARATGLLDLRRMNVRSALEHLIEESNRVQPQAETIVRAIRAYTRINARGEWNEPPSHVIYSTHHENVHQSVHQAVANQLNVAVQPASAPLPPSTPGTLPPPIDIQLLPSAETHPEISASASAQPDSNHGSVIRNHA
jgi:hypothetical protein